MSSNPPPPHKALGRDFFVVGAGLAPDKDHPNTNSTSVINTTIHKTHHDDPTRLVSISDWLVKTLQNTPQFVLRIVRRALPKGDGCCLLDFNGVNQMVILLGDTPKLPTIVPQFNLSVKLVAVDDNLEHAAITCSLLDSLWEHVVVAIDQNGSEKATRIFIVAESMGSAKKEIISPSAVTARIRSRGKDKDLLVDRMETFDSLAEALVEDVAKATQTAKRTSTTTIATASESQPAKKNKTTNNASETIAPEAKASDNKEKAAVQPKDDKTTQKKPVKPVEQEDEAVVIVMPKAAVAAGKRKKDPNQPKKAGSSYNYFFAERMTISKKEHPTDDQAAHSKRVAAEWKTLSKDDKVKYEELAAKDQERYRLAMESYVPSALASDDEAEGGKKKKHKKDPDAPKKPMSGYLIFCNDMRPDLMKSHPGTAFGELTKMVSEAWKKVTPEEKKKYDDAAKHAREAYEQEKSTYDSSKLDAVAGKGAALTAVTKPVENVPEKKATAKSDGSAPKKSNKPVEPTVKDKKAVKSPAKPKHSDKDDNSTSSKSSKASTVGEDSDSSSSTESESSAAAKPPSKGKDERLATSDDDTDDDEKEASTAAKQLLALSPKKRGGKTDKVPETPKRSPRNKNKTAEASASKKSKPIESPAKKGRKSEKEKKDGKSEPEKKDRKSKKGTKDKA